MERSKLIRNIRIAATAGCLVVCVCLIVLWVRSYRVDDVLYGPICEPGYRWTGAKTFLAESTGGHVTVCVGPFSTHHRDSWPWGLQSDWGVIHESHINVVVGRFITLPPVSGLSVFYSASAMGFHVAIIPHWLLVVLTATFATAAWGQWRPHFSLRTLFIATTVIAIVMGLAVFANE